MKPQDILSYATLLLRYCCFLLLGCGSMTLARAQSPNIKPEDLPPQFRPPHPPAKMMVRYFLIDPKRASADIYSDDALPRAREFKRLDSSYYVGWMFEGVYKYEHASDYLGFKNAIAPLEKALKLIEADYAKGLKLRTSDVMAYFPIYKIKIDYTLIANYLMNCYSNTDQPDKVYTLLRSVVKYNLQRQYYMDAYNYLAWTVHRNRFYTHDKYTFLGKNIDENEALASRYLDTSMMLIERNKVIHDKLEPGMVEGEKMSVYHYKNILHSYAFEIDSALHYFNLMKAEGRLPHNNFATFKAVCGEFSTAEEQYEIASNQDPNDKRLQEWAYYTSILDIYKAMPQAGITLSKNMIKASGTTPGYGWYNIALARSLLYDAQIEAANKHTERAATFKEMHIGTTLGQSHYEFSVQLLKLQLQKNRVAMLRFEHSNWWYNPVVLFKMAVAVAQQYMQQFLIINQFAENPERDRVIYKLFSNESTVSWDEIWFLVSDFSTKYFVKKFEFAAVTDKRERIKKYFQLFVAKLKMKQGKYVAAKQQLDALVANGHIDATYERLFLARVCEAEAICCKKLQLAKEQRLWAYKFYTAFPQLTPFSAVTANMALHIKGQADNEVVQQLKKCNIHWDNTPDAYTLQAHVSFSKQGKNKYITYTVTNVQQQTLVASQTFRYTQPQEAGTQLAYKLCNMGDLAAQQP